MELAGEDPETWAVSFLDECWWSRVALPTLNAWGANGGPLRLIQRSVAKDDPSEATKAISCFGLYVPRMDQTWIRFVDGRPVSFVVLRGAPQAAGKKALLLIWDSKRAGMSPNSSGAGSGNTTAASKRAAAG